MKKVAIVGLGWLGMPLALSLTARGWQVTGSKTTQDGVEAARMCGIDSYPLRLEPQLVCEADDLDALMDADAAGDHPAGPPYRARGSVLPAGGAGDSSTPRWRTGSREISLTSSTSVYGDVQRNGEGGDPASCRSNRQRPSSSRSWRTGCTTCRARRWIFCAWPGWWGRPAIRGASLPARRRRTASTCVNLVHLHDVVAAIERCCCRRPKGGHIYNLLCAHAIRRAASFYPQMARELGLPPPVFSDSPDSGKGKIVDGNRICNELGFEYQYPDPLVMPME